MSSENTYITDVYTIISYWKYSTQSPRTDRDRAKMSKRVLKDHKRLKNTALYEVLVPISFKK